MITIFLLNVPRMTSLATLRYTADSKSLEQTLLGALLSQNSPDFLCARSSLNTSLYIFLVCAGTS